MIRNTASEEAPWYVVPADNKWFTRLVVSTVLVDTLEDLKLAYPESGRCEAQGVGSGEEDSPGEEVKIATCCSDGDPSLRPKSGSGQDDNLHWYLKIGRDSALSRTQSLEHFWFFAANGCSDYHSALFTSSPEKA